VLGKLAQKDFATADPKGATLKYMLITSLSVVLSLTFGILCFVRAARIAQFYRNHYASHRFLRSAVMFPFRALVESDYYETSIRACGVFMILLAVFLAFVTIQGLFG
jgi:hypothetical protein